MTAVGNTRFEHTATGVLGDKRESMLENQLLLRNQLGRPSRRGYRGYPGDEERYGRPNPACNGGVQGALSGSGGGSSSVAQAGLHFPKKGGEAGDSAAPGQDFMALNKSAVQSGLVNSSQQQNFRATHNIRRKPQAEGDPAAQCSKSAAAGGGRSSTRRLPPSMVFGISTRPSTPIHDLLEHKYQDRWLAERRSADLAQKQHTLLAQRGMPGTVNQTRTSMLRIHQIPVDQGRLWTMPRFNQNAKASLNTFRTEGLRNSAYRQQSLDGIARQGTFGLGIYEPAKC